MRLDDALYRVGEGAERFLNSIKRGVREVISPSKSEEVPEFKTLRRLFKKRNLTVHEYLSLSLQLSFILYLVLSLVVVVLSTNPLYLVALFTAEFLYQRMLIKKNWEFFVDPETYRVFYLSISVISFAAFLGYMLLRRTAPNIQYYSIYLVIVLGAVIAFRWYFRENYGRDYTYGVVEEVKNGHIKVFVHDDIAANVKPGYYWVESVPDALPGRVVKLLVEEKKMRGSVPKAVLEVYLEGQSSQTSAEPKEETA